MIINKATNVIAAYKQCNPDYALPADDDRYVDLSDVRGEHKRIISTIRRSIERSEDNTCTYLISGHRGCGKTTELYRLKQQLLNEQYFCVYFDVGEALDLADISYIDIFLALVDEVSRTLNDEKIYINEEILADVHNWMSQEITQEYSQSKDVDAKAGAGGQASVGIPSVIKLFANLTGDIKHSQSQRTIIRERVEKRASDFISLINQFLIAVRNAIKQESDSYKYEDIVIIVDGLEKIQYRTFMFHDNQSDSHTELFVKHAEQLLSLRSHIVYTVPIGLMFTTNLQNDFEKVHILPMVKLNEAGKQALYEVVSKRVDIACVFEDNRLVTSLIEASGGVIRDLMRLVRLSCDTDDKKITSNEVKYAIAKLTREYDRLLKKSDVPILAEVYHSKTVNPDNERTNQLLHNRVILEYENGTRFAKLHPACLKVEWLKQALESDNADATNGMS